MAMLPGEKGAIAIASIVVVVGSFFGIRALMKNADERKARREGRELDKTVTDDIKGAKGKPTSIATNYKLFADRLYKALNVWNPNPAQVYQIFSQMNNDRDILELIKAFAMRLDTSNGISTDEMANLGSFIQKLEPEEINALNTITLANRGIRYRF
jgi:hypothetical protein